MHASQWAEPSVQLYDGSRRVDLRLLTAGVAPIDRFAVQPGMWFRSTWIEGAGAQPRNYRRVLAVLRSVVNDPTAEPLKRRF